MKRPKVIIKKDGWWSMGELRGSVMRQNPMVVQFVVLYSYIISGFEVFKMQQKLLHLI
jgi:hypothetical protein